LDSARSKINITSSEGPTRDGRFKPDVAADGTDIAAANGFDPSARWVEMTGTSMASPLVAGVAGLMLKVRPQLTAAQIGGIMQRTARPLPGSSYEWAKNAGFGTISPADCVSEAARVADRKDRTKEFKKQEWSDAADHVPLGQGRLPPPRKRRPESQEEARTVRRRHAQQLCSQRRR